MENAFFIMGGATSQRLPITISKLHICTWNMRDCNAYFELGIEIAANTLSLNVDYSISFLAEWLSPDCEIISLHEKFADSDNSETGGDTFIFNSPKPIDEIEAAKQMKKAKRELAEGF